MEKAPTLGSQAYSAVVANLLKQSRLMPLGRGTPDEGIASTLRSLAVETTFAPRRVANKTSARLCLAGIWLLYDHLEECHRIAQELDTRDAAYWHAIMHRREGDFSNSKHRFRQVGEHSTFTALQAEVRNLASNFKFENATSFLVKQPRWDPLAFVDLCEDCVKGRTPSEDLCREIQHVEWQLLFDHCYRKATGG